MPIALQVFLIIALTVLMTALVAYTVHKCYFKKDFELNINTLIEWIHESSLIFFDNDSEKYEGDIKKLASQLNSFLHDDNYLDEEGSAMMQDLVDSMESENAT